MPYQPDYPVPEERQPYTELAVSKNENGRIGCLMLHGFMGSPLSSHAMARYLAQHGMTVHCPLLPGHGHYPDKLYNVPRQAWIDEAEEGLQTIRQLGDEIFVMGHSMGVILAAQLCIQNPDIRGLIMLTPIYDVPDNRLKWMKLLRFVMRYLYPHRMRSMQKLVQERVLDFDPTVDFNDPEFRRTLLPRMSRIPTGALYEMVKMIEYGRTLWPLLKQPSIIFCGDKDPAVKPQTIETLYAALPGPDKQLKIFLDTGHEPMRTYEPVHTELWQMAVDFVRTRSSIGLKTVPA